jgi:hypothetical protein
LGHGAKEAKTTNRRYTIVEKNGGYRVKKRMGPFWSYVRTKGKILIFDDFSEVVRYIIERKKEDFNRN